MKLLCNFLFPVWILTAATVSFAEQPLVIAVDHANPPFMYKTKSTNEARGLYPDIIESVFSKMKKPVNIEAMPWNRVLNLGKKGIVGIGGIYKTKERIRIYDYSRPIFKEKLVIYIKTGKAFYFDILSDLSGKTVGVIRGWSYGDAFDLARKQGVFTAIDSKSDEINFRHLLQDNVDCIISIQEAANKIIKSKGYHGEVMMLPKPIAVNSTYLVFNKNSGNTALIKEFNAVLRRMKQNGTYDSIINKSLD